MPTLYVGNVPDDLYDALRQTARQHGRSIAEEVRSLLEQTVVTPAELKSRREFLRRAERLRSKAPISAESFPSTEQMQREDRRR